MVSPQHMFHKLATLESIRHFLEHVVQAASEELKDIEEKNATGAFPEFADYEHALDYPLLRVEIASRAVLYEVTALVEYSVYEAAHHAWLGSPNRKGPKTLLQLPDPVSESLSSLRMVTDLRFPDVVALFEAHYEASVRTLPGWGVFSQARDIVNAFKHTNGFIDFRKVPLEEARIGVRYLVGADQARAAIAAAQSFLTALYAATHPKTGPDAGTR